MELFINNKSGAPIYDQIYNQIKQQIISGAFSRTRPSLIGGWHGICASASLPQSAPTMNWEKRGLPLRSTGKGLFCSP